MRNVVRSLFRSVPAPRIEDETVTLEIPVEPFCNPLLHDTVRDMVNNGFEVYAMGPLNGSCVDVMFIKRGPRRGFFDRLFRPLEGKDWEDSQI